MTPAITLQIPDERLLHHFPEAACLAVLDAALAAVQGVLRAEHPTVDDLPFDPEHDIVPSLLTARLILSRAGELRELLRLYSAAVARTVNDTFDIDDDDVTFVTGAPTPSSAMQLVPAMTRACEDDTVRRTGSGLW